MSNSLRWCKGTTDRFNPETGEEEEAPILIAEESCYQFVAEQQYDLGDEEEGWTWRIVARHVTDDGELWLRVAFTDDPMSREEAQRTLTLWAHRLRRLREPGRTPCALCSGIGVITSTFDGGECHLCDGRGYWRTESLASC